MPAATWKIDERRDLLRMRTVYGLNDQQACDLIGRIYGEAWRFSDPPRKKYTSKDTRDEISSRWRFGHRHGDYRIIDPESGIFSAQEQHQQNLSDQRIRMAAAQSGGRNWLRENSKGALITPNQPVQLSPNPILYRRDPATFDAAFTAAQNQKTRERSAAPSTSSRARASAAPASSHQAGPSRPSARTATSSAPKPPTAARSAYTTQTEQSETMPSSIARGSSRRATTVSSTYRLPMVHSNDVHIEAGHHTLPANRVVKSIPQTSAVYKHGGELAHIWNPRKERFEDLLLCDPDVCCRCNGCGRANDLAIKVRRSPTDGLPFVHVGRDSILNDEGEHVFQKTASVSATELFVPPHKDTMSADMWCVSEGKTVLVEVLGCTKERCDVCSPVPGGRGSPQYEGGYYGENLAALEDAYEEDREVDANDEELEGS